MTNGAPEPSYSSAKSTVYVSGQNNQQQPKPSALAPAQPLPAQSGLVGLAMIAVRYRIAVDPAQLVHELALTSRSAEADDIVRAAKHVGLKAKVLREQPFKRLNSVPLPALIGLKDGGYAVLAARMPDGTFRTVNPLNPGAEALTPIALLGRWNGEVILVTRRLGGVGVDPGLFNFKWFLPSIWRYRKPLGHVLGASLFVQLFALITPLFFQIVVDKVLLHRSMSTLIVIVVGLIVMGLFDVILQYLRTYALSHTTSRIDVELGARLFDHLLRFILRPSP